MKKYISKIVSLLMCCSLGVSLVACDNTTSGGGDKDINNGQNSSDAYNEFIDTYVDTINKNNVTDSDKILYSNGVTDYSIVVSSDSYSQKVEIKAADEINFFMNDAVGIRFPVLVEGRDTIASAVDDDGNFVNTNKYICIGNTSFYKASPMYGTLNSSDMGNDGFGIQTYGNTVIMNACGNNGIIYSAYGFLERNMDYHYYAQDEWRIAKDSTRYLKNMDVIDVPEFESRMLDTATNTSATSDWLVRLRHHGSQGSLYNYDGMEAAGWKLSDQSLCLELLDYRTYQVGHPSWYNGDGASKSGQMCMTTVLKNEPTGSDNISPLDEMFKNLVGYIQAYPNDRVFMLGINDNETHKCRCGDCSEEVAKIKYSGQICLLANALMKRIESWQEGTYAEDYPDTHTSAPVAEPTDNDKERTINLSFFAYLYTIEAPMTYSAATDSYEVVPYDAPYKDFGGDGVNGDGDDNDLPLRNNIIVRIAPIGSVNMHTHYDREYNQQAYIAFTTWSQMSTKLAVWDYGTTFSDYISPYPDWGVIQDDFKYFRACNVKELLTQLPAHTSGTSFYALMLYLRSQLMWNMDQDVEYLIQDFFYNYYGPQAYDAMYGYFNWLRNYFQMADATYEDANGNVIKGFKNANGDVVEYHGYIYEVFTTSKWFPLVTLNQLKTFFTTAENQLALVKNTEPKYQKYLDRVHVESLFIRYIDLANYSSYYSNDQLADMIDKFEDYAALGNLTQLSNAGKNGVQQIRDFISNCRNRLN